MSRGQIVLSFFRLCTRTQKVNKHHLEEPSAATRRPTASHRYNLVQKGQLAGERISVLEDRLVN